MLLTPSGCRDRQKRLAEWMTQEQVDVSVVTHPSHVYYLTGALPVRDWPMAAIVRAEGHTTLIDHAERDDVGADDVLRYEPQTLCAIKPLLERLVANHVADVLSNQKPGKAAIEHSHCIPYVADHLSCPTVNLDEPLREMRRHKDPDELAVLQRLIEIGDCGYAAAREMMTPGNDELDIYNTIHDAMVTEAGEEVTVVGANFACGQMGGPPRQGRKIAAGELNIFDMGPQHWRYCGDSCRTLAVGGEITAEQQRAREFVVEALRTVERTVKPGVRTLELWDAVKSHLDTHQPGAFCHHLGHGIGLAIHETPYLNPDFDDVFAEGDVFTADGRLTYKRVSSPSEGRGTSANPSHNP